MATLILRNRLGYQVAEAMRTDLERGSWAERIPSERSLSKRYGVSRPVLRQGLELLKQAGLILVEPRRGYRICSAPRRTSKVATDVHLLLPRPAMEMRLFTNLWLAELRQRLSGDGIMLQIHVGPQHFRGHAPRSLGKLVRENPGSAWVLVHSTRGIQEWFAARGLPAVVAGSVHPNVRLPSIRIDVGAAARHVVGVFRRSGHKRIAFLNLKSNRAGDQESETQFLQTALQSGLDAQLLHHDSSAESVGRAVRRLFQRSPYPTGLFVGHSQTYLSAASSLSLLGRRVPDDLSLVAREDDPFLDALLPAPARYHANSARYAGQIHRALLALRAGQLVDNSVRPIVPEFSPGRSIRVVS